MTGTLTPLDLAALAAGSILLLALLAALGRLALAARRHATRAQAVTIGLLIPAAMGLAMSASTSYRYAGVHLGITDVSERMALCGVAEAGIIALTLHSWGAKSKGSALLAYGFVGAQAIPAFEVSGGAGGIVRIVLGPIMLALMLHRLLGLEVKFSGEKSTGLLASLGRELRERLVARLGIGRRGPDSAAIARSRAADRAVRLASGRKLTRRAAGRLAEAIDAAQHGLEPADAACAEAAIVARVARRKSVADLHGLALQHVWSTTVVSAPVSLAEAAETPDAEIAGPDTTGDTTPPGALVVSGWTGARPSVHRRARMAPRALRTARVQPPARTVAEQPKTVRRTTEADASEQEPAPPSQGGKKRPSVRPAVIALRAAHPDMPTDTIAEILAVSERTVSRYLPPKKTAIEQSNGHLMAFTGRK